MPAVCRIPNQGQTLPSQALDSSDGQIHVVCPGECLWAFTVVVKGERLVRGNVFLLDCVVVTVQGICSDAHDNGLILH